MSPASKKSSTEYFKFLDIPGLSINDQEIKISETRCSSLLHRLDYGGRRSSEEEFTINVYKGCTHNCSYCYAPSLIRDERKWGSYVDVKINAPIVLEREMREMRDKKVILVSSASDPYQAIESRYKVTRHCLEVLRRHQFPVIILTRSPLVLRDLDILKKFEWVRVGMSISSLSGDFFEPGVPKLKARLKTLEKLGEESIKTWVSLAPIAPQILLSNFEWLFKRLKGAKVSAVSLGMLRFVGYEASRTMFEERTGVDSRKVLEDGVRIIGELRELAQSNGLDTSCSSLNYDKRNFDSTSWKSSTIDNYMEQHVRQLT
jgi:DNA repair photolyase